MTHFAFGTRPYSRSYYRYAAASAPSHPTVPSSCPVQAVGTVVASFSDPPFPHAQAPHPCTTHTPFRHRPPGLGFPGPTSPPCSRVTWDVRIGDGRSRGRDAPIIRVNTPALEYMCCYDLVKERNRPSWIHLSLFYSPDGGATHISYILCLLDHVVRRRDNALACMYIGAGSATRCQQ